MRKLTVSVNRKADHTVAGEILMDARELLKEDLSITQRLESLKTASTAIKNRLDLRAENRKDAMAQIQIDEHNARFERQIKIVNIELADVE